MKPYSLTIGGILAMILVPLLVDRFGFSESCSGEIGQTLSVLPGAIMAWVGRYRQGGITPLGFKKVR